MSTLDLADTRNRPFYWIENEAFNILSRAVENCKSSKDVHKRRIGPLCHAVYGALARYTNTRTGKAWPHVDTLCKAVGAGRSQVFVALGVLEDYYLIRRQSGAKDGKGSTYLILDASAARQRLNEVGPGRPMPQDLEPVDGGVRAADGGVRAADASSKPLRDGGVTSETPEPKAATTVNRRPARPSKGRKTPDARVQQELFKKDEKNNKVRPRCGAAGPLSVRSILAQIGGKTDKEERTLTDRIVNWLTNPEYPHARVLKNSVDAVRGQVSASLRKIGLDKMKEIFEYAANGADPHPTKFWGRVNVYAKS
ncbi:MAG: helix-turn-helix domain-containing protein [Pseudomonadota bacterium]